MKDLEPMRILHVLTSGAESARGIVQTVVNLADTLDRKRYILSVLFLREGGAISALLEKSGVSSDVARWRGDIGDIPGVIRFSSYIAGGRFDIIHFHAGGIGPRFLSKVVSRARVVAHYHSLVEESGVRVRRPRRSSFADLVVANSDATARTIRGTPARVIHPGIRVPRNGHSENGFVNTITVGVASRLVSLKGIGDLIAAIAILRRKGLDARLDIAGAGPERRALEQEASSHEVSDRVRFLGWIDDVPAAMSRWQVYAQPSHAEGFGLSVLEAMGAGLPVVATSVGGLPEIVLEGDTGFLVPPGSPALLAERIERLVRAPQLRTRMGNRGRARAQAEFSAERESIEIRSAYESLLA